jgi:D-3-phosphoglycerate dehydrogenase / 2-oxoglutarate reductase
MDAGPTYIFDFDSTLIRLESLDELARIALGGQPEQAARVAKLQRITSMGMTGNLSFGESLRRRLALFQAHQLHVAKLVECLQDAWTPSIWQQRDWFRAHAGRVYVVSGGFADYIVPLVSTLGIMPDHVFANQFLFDACGTIVGFDERNLLSHPQGKAKVVMNLGFKRQVIMIGDGYTDYEVRALGGADQFWAFTENITRPQVVRLADRILDSWPMEQAGFDIDPFVPSAE